MWFIGMLLGLKLSWVFVSSPHVLSAFFSRLQDGIIHEPGAAYIELYSFLQTVAGIARAL